MRSAGTDLLYYQARAAAELELALGAAHPEAAKAHHELALRYFALVERLSGAAAASPDQPSPSADSASPTFGRAAARAW